MTSTGWIFFILSFFLTLGLPLFAEENSRVAEEISLEKKGFPRPLVEAQELNLSQETLRLLPNGNHVSSLLEFLYQPAVLSNVDTGGFSIPENTQFSMFGESYKWQRWYFLNADISHPMKSGEPFIYLPLGVLQNITTRKYAAAHTEKNGVHLMPLGIEEAKRHAEISLPFAVGGVGFIPRATADREPASDWGAPQKSRGFLFPSAEGHVLIPLGKSGYLFADAQMQERHFNTLTTPERAHSTTLLAALSPAWQENDRLMLSTQLRSRTALGAEYFFDEKQTLNNTQYAALVNYMFDSTRAAGAIALGYAYRDSTPNGKVLSRSLTQSLIQAPPIFPENAHSLFWDASGYRKKALSWAHLEYGVNARLEMDFRRQNPASGQMQETLYAVPFALTQYEPSTREANYLLRWQPFVRAQKEWGKTTLQGGTNAHIDWGFTDTGTKLAEIHPAANVKIKTDLGASPFYITGALLHDTLGFSLQEVSFLNPDSLSGTRYLWNDANNNGVADVGELSSPARTGGKYHTGAKALEAPQKEEVNFSFGYKGISNYLLQFNINARAYRKLFEVRYQDGSQVSTTASTAGAGVPVYNVIASGNETYTLTNMDKNAYYTHFEIAVLQLPSASNWIFHGSIGGYFGAGYSPQGLAAFYNDVGVYNESTADPNFRENRFGRLDNDRGYMGKIVFGYRFLKTLSVVNVLRYRDGEPMVKDRLVTGLAQGPIVVPITERGGGLSGVGRHTYSLAWDLRLRYDAALWGNTVWAFLDVYNLLNSRTELAEYPLEGTAFRDPVEQGIERTVRLGLGMQF